MGALITPWHGDHDIRSNRSQLVPIQFKSSPSYVKHTVRTKICGNFFTEQEQQGDCVTFVEDKD